MTSSNPSGGGQAAFTLIEMSIVMVIIGILVSIVMTVMPSVVKTAKIKEARAKLSKYEKALQGYAISNYRLPFADSNGDGRENTNTYVGTLPFLTLGLSSGSDPWNNPVKYAVYGKPYGVWSLTDTSKANLCNVLTQINNSINASGFDRKVAYTCKDACVTPPQDSVNQAFILASGGARDKDGANGYFDGCNGRGTRFNADNRIHANDYDDVVRSFSLNEFNQMICTP